MCRRIWAASLGNFLFGCMLGSTAWSGDFGFAAGYPPYCLLVVGMRWPGWSFSWRGADCLGGVWRAGDWRGESGGEFCPGLCAPAARARDAWQIGDVWPILRAQGTGCAASPGSCAAAPTLTVGGRDAHCRACATAMSVKPASGRLASHPAWLHNQPHEISLRPVSGHPVLPRFPSPATSTSPRRWPWRPRLAKWRSAGSSIARLTPCNGVAQQADCRAGRRHALCCTTSPSSCGSPPCCNWLMGVGFAGQPRHGQAAEIPDGQTAHPARSRLAAPGVWRGWRFLPGWRA